jgi:Histidine kinase-, DNA gyrase B-, and HSP90-like ATPase
MKKIDNTTALFDQFLQDIPSFNNYNVDNPPNPGKMIQSMRTLGYNNYSAICDIVDNCLDAEATKIWINVNHKDNSPVITIVDNGYGMDLETLNQALKLGSNTFRDSATDLGKYGMGLVTASLSICQRVEVITKQKNSPIYYSVQDTEIVRETNSFVKILEEANPQIQEIYKSFLGEEESGTVVILRKCDQITNSNLTVFRNILIKKIGQTFRFFINGGKEIKLNGDLIESIDPIMLSNEAETQSDDQYTINYKNENGEELSSIIQVRIAVLPDFGIEGNRIRSINIPNQGIYLLRNYREIATGETFGLFQKHNDLNRIRIEVFVSAELDSLIGVDFTKQKPEPKQAILDKLRDAIVPSVKSLRGRLAKARTSAGSSDVPHNESEKQIGRKAHLLAKPKLEIEKRSPKLNNGNRKTENGENKERKNFSNSQKKNVTLPARFETVSMTPAGPIWDSEVEGKTIVIRWNIDHPFYQRFLLENKENPSMITATDFLVYSLSSAELQYTQDDDEETQNDRQYMMENIRATVSNNMRTLLS